MKPASPSRVRLGPRQAKGAPVATDFPANLRSERSTCRPSAEDKRTRTAGRLARSINASSFGCTPPLLPRPIRWHNTAAPRQATWIFLPAQARRPPSGLTPRGPSQSPSFFSLNYPTLTAKLTKKLHTNKEREQTSEAKPHEKSTGPFLTASGSRHIFSTTLVSFPAISSTHLRCSLSEGRK